jgi:hypothetical protein
VILQRYIPRFFAGFLSDFASSISARIRRHRQSLQGLKGLLKNSRCALRSPSAAKAVDEKKAYRSGKPLRHPKANVRSGLSALGGTAEAVPFQNYNGIFPCFFGGFLSRLVSSISSA